MKLVEKSRRFSKRMVIANCALAWAAVFVSIVYLQAAYVATTAMGLIVAIGGAYMGIGHMDLRQVVKALVSGRVVEPPADSYVPADPTDGAGE